MKKPKRLCVIRSIAAFAVTLGMVTALVMFICAVAINWRHVTDAEYWKDALSAFVSMFLFALPITALVALIAHRIETMPPNPKAVDRLTHHK